MWRKDTVLSIATVLWAEFISSPTHPDWLWEWPSLLFNDCWQLFPQRCKNPLEKFSPRFFGIKTASSLLIIFQRAKLSLQNITHLCWCNWRTFWRKNVAGREGHQGGLVLAQQCPSSLGTCNPEESGLPGLPLSWSPTLFSGSGPVRLPPVPWTEKTIDMWPLLSNAEVIAATETWLGGQPSEFFLSGLQKLEQQTKKCIELCGEYVE